jgi:hypothetical protein
MRHSINFKGKIMTTATLPRTINRGSNPYAPIVKQQNQRLTPVHNNGVYQPITQRAGAVHNHSGIQQALKILAARMGGKKFSNAHCGELIWVPFSLLDINIEIQRDAEAEHQAKIITRFDPRIYMPVMATKLANGRYSAWEGQQTACTLYHLHQAGLLEEDFLVQVKAFDEDLTVPGSTLVGEAVGNYGFRQINGGMRKPIDAFHLHRSRVNGVRMYNSVFEEDVQSEIIQQTLEQHNMFPAKSADAKYNRATPGMITYIHGLNLIAGHGTEMKKFDMTITDLEWALKWHNTYYPNEKGVDGGFILAFGRLHAAARASKPAITLDAATEADLFKLFQSEYGSPKSFHNFCQQRWKSFTARNNMPESWSDSCLTPILVMDYINWGGRCALPQVPHMTTYAGI